MDNYDFTYTGAEIQAILDTGKKLKDSGYIFLGVATPSTNPGTPTQKVYYEAKQAGTYTNFGGVVLPDGISLLIWNGSWTSETVMCGDGGVFDISVYKSSGGTLAKYTDLAAALGTNGANIPEAIRKGGMSVKFVLSSDNKYVQFNLTAQSFTTDVTQWDSIAVIRDNNENDLNITDDDGRVLAKFKNGEFYTKKFSSDNLKVSDSLKDDFSISDEDGNRIVVLSGGDIKTKNFDSSVKNLPRYITIAASNSIEGFKKAADYVCTGTNDEAVINAAIETLTKGGTIQFFDGDYYIDAFTSPRKTAILFGGNNRKARVINIIGTTENKSYNTHYGVVFHVTETAINSMNDVDNYRVFCGADIAPEGGGDFGSMTYVNNVNFKNFYIYFHNASKRIIGIDCTYFGNSEMEQVGVYTKEYFNDRFLHRKPATPVVGSIGVIAPKSSCDEMARIGMTCVNCGGMHTGIKVIGTDHLIMKTCTVARCVVGYHFVGEVSKTLTIINCCDEGNYRLPKFEGKGHLTCIDFNCERFNAAYIPDDPENSGIHQATESINGGWHGFISYTLQGSAFNIADFFGEGSGQNFKIFNLNDPASAWF